MTKLRVKAQKAGDTRTKPLPTFLCTDHAVPLVYYPELAIWKCPEQPCNQVKRAELGGSMTTPAKITGFPKVVVEYDKEGDPHYFFYYEDRNLMVELPYTMVTGHRIYTHDAIRPPGMIIQVLTEDFMFVNTDGHEVPIDQVADR